MFPNIGLLGGSVTPSGFYYDFIFPHSIHPELHQQIEEKMRQIAREKREIRVLEMVAVSAKEFLKSKGNRERASQIEGSGLFEVVEIGSFIDLTQGNHIKNTAQLHCFKLFSPISFEGGMRIMGTAFDTKEELKEFIKKWQSYPQKRHEKIGANKHFWRSIEEGYLWLPQGLKAEAELIATLKENLYPGAIEVRRPIHTDRTKNQTQFLQSLNCEAACEIFPIQRLISGGEDVGFFDSSEGKELQITISLKNRISCLQFIGNTLNILCFSYSIRFSSSRRNAKGTRLLVDALNQLGWAYQDSDEEEEFPLAQFLVSDGLGRLWSSVSIRVQECLSVQVRVERNLALLLEKQEAENYIV